MDDKLVEAACVVCPDGAVYWCDATSDAIRLCWQRWQEARGIEEVERLRAAGCQGGVVIVRVMTSALERLRTLL